MRADGCLHLLVPYQSIVLSSRAVLGFSYTPVLRIYRLRAADIRLPTPTADRFDVLRRRDGDFSPLWNRVSFGHDGWRRASP